MVSTAVMGPEILFCSSWESDLGEFSILWSFLHMKAVFKSIMSSIVLFNQFEGKIITALNEFLCRKLPKDLSPKWFEFQYKIRNSCFSPITTIFLSASQFCFCMVCSFKTSSSGYFKSSFYESCFEVTYVYINHFFQLCVSQPLLNWTNGENCVYSYQIY